MRPSSPPSKKALFLTVLAAVFLVSACAPSDSNSAKDGGIKAYDDGTNEPIYVSEISADEGEELLSPETLDRALEKFDIAVKANPSNSRAQFWRSFLRFQMELKGIVARVRPLFASLPSGDFRYERFADRVLENTTPDSRQFYLSGPADITSPELFQEWLDRLTLRLAEARETYHTLKTGREFQIRAPRAFIAGSSSPSTSGQRCQGRFGPIVYQPADCNSAYFEAYLNRADLEVLTSALSVFQTELTVLNAWRLDSSMTALMVDNAASPTSLSVAQWINSGHAKLRSASTMKASRAATRDFASSYQWLMRNQKNACPKGRESKKNRPGYLFAFGLCFITKAGEEAEAAKLVQILETVINGGALTSSMIGEKRFDFTFDWVRFFEEPLDSLSSLREVKVNECSEVTSINDSSMKTYFPKGSINDFLKTSIGCAP